MFCDKFDKKTKNCIITLPIKTGRMIEILNENFFQDIQGKRDIAPLHCPICERQLFVDSASENLSVVIQCYACSVSYELRRLGNTIRAVPQTGLIETLSNFQRLLENNTVELPGCPKCGKDDLHTQVGEMKCCDVLWMPIVREGNIVYDVKSLTATHPFENPILSIDHEVYTRNMAMFAAKHVQVSSNVSSVLREVHETGTLSTTSTGEEVYHTDVAGQILTYLSRQPNHTATRKEMLSVIHGSDSRFKAAIRELIEARKIRRVSRGVYELIIP